MNFMEFIIFVENLKQQHPIWFGLDSDKPPSIDDIQATEEKLGIKFPNDYLDFVNEFGGGYFAFSNIYSLEKESDWNILDRNLKYANIRKNYILVSENGAGDFYGFKAENGVCKPQIHFYDHDEGSWQETEISNIFEYLKELALSN